MTLFALRCGWVLMAALALLIALASICYFAFPLSPIAPPNLAAAFFNEQPFLYAHVFAATIALAIGPFQFAGAIRHKWPVVHRSLGRVYLVACLIGGVAALRLAVDSGGGWVGHVGFGMLGAVWLISGGMAFRRVLGRDFDAHQEWMIRSYALTFAAVTLRIWLPVFDATIGLDEGYPLVSWLCWVPNLIVAEVVVHAVRERRERLGIHSLPAALA